ncbi:glycosyltransferase [Pseudophaeobacter flagellatus]|uniref:glycosyltransferase n=1 Tax=Pseudophaeobacter flagellatus TaxID=2899119 RepID=UPI001E35DC98|nr:glycosyltransferase [Pseudophaeobacter flagellatus]MCD9147449.1 putative rhamnosyl transferase [Pseudophaeobacter flagellatus]
MTQRMKMVGLVRFSVLTPTYYSERFATLDETAAHLFAPERMALRFSIFESLCLPSLLRQSDGDFDLVVLTAAAMPEIYLNRLSALLEPHDNIHLRLVGTRNHYRLLRQGYDSVPQNDASHRILFRLDDDDAVDLDFVCRTRALATGLLPLQPPETGFVIAHNRGFYLRATPQGPQIFDAIEQAPLSAGTALVAPKGSSTNPYRYNHRKLARHHNLYSDMQVPAYIRTIHGDNKSEPAQTGITHRMEQAEMDASLQRHFGLCLADLEAI